MNDDSMGGEDGGREREEERAEEGKKKSDKMPVIQCLISSEIRTHSLSVEMSQVECYVEMEKEEKMKEEREKRRKRGRSPDE
ncbi:hypothetical protein PRIPAC_71084 [Pristionchus pacificus]|uniref:Uncharacterized protein n=1 Tax=Pristionchus pacificus TaxID=54126 RepID=A0A2A6CFW9_PRIPA|nr:hypothetical protein PRIPAC_71084 [Pristionchus pacificus]|eukprot:PDM77006.1 hypothetical protein PRIPAC_42401 [Pristionchus pacificus]